MKLKKRKQFECPCGKSYGSNPALFTHIKIKHDGKAPGDTIKPINCYSKRGRPSYEMRKQKKQQIQIQKNTIYNQAHHPSLSSVSQQRTYIQKTPFQSFQQIFQYIKQIGKQQKINPNLWNEIQAFKLIESYFEIKQSKQVKQTQLKQVSLGQGLVEFMKTLAIRLLRTEIEQFSQINLIFVALLQYVIDETNNKNILQEAKVDILIDYMNPFVNQHLELVTVDYSIQNFWISKMQNISKIFYCFYRWLIYKNYTSYQMIIPELFEQSNEEDSQPKSTGQNQS